MNTTASLAGIPFNQINTHDPLIAQWALSRISDLRRRDEKSADAAIHALFDEAAISLMLSDFTSDVLLICLFRELPDDLLKPHLSFLSEIWKKLPAWSCYQPVRLLARHYPDRAMEIFLEYLKHPPYESERVYAIIEAAGELPEAAMKQLVDAHMAAISTEKKEPALGRAHTCLLADLAWKAGHPQALDLIKIIAKAMPDQGPDAVDADLKFLTGMLMATPEPLSMILDLWEGYEVPLFADVSPFLPDSGLTAQLDDVVRTLGNFEYRPTLDFYEQHKQRLPERVIMVLDACRDMWQAIPDFDENKTIPTLFSLFPACIAASAWITNPEPATGDTDSIISFLTMNLRDVPATDVVISHFSALERHHAVACLTEALTAHMDSYGAVRIAGIMGRLRWQEFVKPLIDAASADFDLLCETCATALAGYGQEAVGPIIEALESDQEERNYYLEDILEQSGCEQAVAYFERHFSELAKSDKETLASAMEVLPEQRFIERLAPFVGKGQNMMDRAYLILNKLHEIESDELAVLEEAYLAYETEDAERRAALDINDLGSVTRDELNLEMICSDCGDISHYQVKSVYVEQSGNKPFVTDDLKCISCAAEDSLDLTDAGAMPVSVELARIVSIKDVEKRRKAFNSSPIVLTPRFTAFGKEMRIRDAIKLYRKELSRQPQNAEHHLGFGNILKYISRFDKARACFKEAIRLEPRLIEAYFHCAQMDDSDGDYRKAFLALHEGTMFLPDVLTPQLAPDKRSEFINAYVAHYNGIKRYLSMPGPAISHSMFGASVKVGRNDPCTCGSGKKFKKCCGK